MSELWDNIKRDLPELRKLQKETREMFGLEDLVYRFYHHSYKAYHARGITRDIVSALERLAPEGTEICSEFRKIVDDGTRENFSTAYNKDWDRHVRPVINALFHATYFLDMAVKYGGRYKKEPKLLPSGYAALLELYGLR